MAAIIPERPALRGSYRSLGRCLAPKTDVTPCFRQTTALPSIRFWAGYLASKSVRSDLSRRRGPEPWKTVQYAFRQRRQERVILRGDEKATGVLRCLIPRRKARGRSPLDPSASKRPGLARVSSPGVPAGC